MIKLVVVVFVTLVISMGILLPVYSQQNAVKSADASVADSTKIDRLLEIAGSYYFSKPDSCIIYTREAIELAQKANLPYRQIMALNMSGEALRFLGDFPHALEMQYKALNLSRQFDNPYDESASLAFIGFIYTEFNEYRLALDNLLLSSKISDSILARGNAIVPKYYRSGPSYLTLVCFNISNTGHAYEGMNLLDSALYYQERALEQVAQLDHGNLRALILERMGFLMSRLGNHSEALMYCKMALDAAYKINDKVNPGKIQLIMASTYFELSKPDSSLFYARESYKSSVLTSQKLTQLQASSFLARLYQHLKLPDSTIRYQEIAMVLKDSIFGQNKFRQLQLLTLREKEYQQEILASQEKFKTRTKFLGLFSVLAFLLIVAGLLLRNNKQKQKQTFCYCPKNKKYRIHWIN